jgi:hypothetical protein
MRRMGIHLTFITLLDPASAAIFDGFRLGSQLLIAVRQNKLVRSLIDRLDGAVNGS